jgi:hypothetical protein
MCVYIVELENRNAIGYYHDVKDVLRKAIVSLRWKINYL